MRILHVSMYYANEYAQALDLYRHQVVEVTSLEEALRQLASASFDVVLIDNEEAPELIQFTKDARIVCPDIPIFVASIWGSDLPEVLTSLKL